MGDINQSFAAEMTDPTTGKIMEMTAGAGQAAMTDAYNTFNTAAVIMPAFNAAISRAVTTVQDLNVAIDAFVKDLRTKVNNGLYIGGPN